MRRKQPLVSAKAWARIRLFAMDVDGVLTDGTVAISSDGTEAKSFSILDGLGLKRLERAGWLDAEWRQTENSRRAKVYTLTRSGRKQLEHETADWNRRVAAVARLLRAEG